MASSFFTPSGSFELGLLPLQVGATPPPPGRLEDGQLRVFGSPFSFSSLNWASRIGCSRLLVLPVGRGGALQPGHLHRRALLVVGAPPACRSGHHRHREQSRIIVCPPGKGGIVASRRAACVSGLMPRPGGRTFPPARQTAARPASVGRLQPRVTARCQCAVVLRVARRGLVHRFSSPATAAFTARRVERSRGRPPGRGTVAAAPSGRSASIQFGDGSVTPSIQNPPALCEQPRAGGPDRACASGGSSASGRRLSQMTNGSGSSVAAASDGQHVERLLVQPRADTPPRGTRRPPPRSSGTRRTPAGACRTRTRPVRRAVSGAGDATIRCRPFPPGRHPVRGLHPAFQPLPRHPLVFVQCRSRTAPAPPAAAGRRRSTVPNSRCGRSSQRSPWSTMFPLVPGGLPGRRVHSSRRVGGIPVWPRGAEFG